MTNTENTTTAADTDTPRGRSAVHHVLATGYTGSTGPGVAATISLVIDGDARIVFDPGMVSHRSVITDALGELGLKTDDITDVVLSHHHPDNVMNAGLFTSARVHDHKAIYDGHGWTTRDAEGHEFTPSLRLLETPGTATRTSPSSSAPPTAWWPSSVTCGGARTGPRRTR